MSIKLVNPVISPLTSNASVSQSPSSGPFQASSVMLLTISQNLPKKRQMSHKYTDRAHIYKDAYKYKAES